LDDDLTARAHKDLPLAAAFCIVIALSASASTEVRTIERAKTAAPLIKSHPIVCRLVHRVHEFADLLRHRFDGCNQWMVVPVHMIEFDVGVLGISPHVVAEKLRSE
jgi:hypothetical protein